MSKTYFVTGGSGYVGRNIVRELVGRSQHVKALARSERSAAVVRELGAQPVSGDIMDSDSLRSGMAGAGILIHAAADTSHGLMSPAQQRNNQQGTQNVFDAARQAGIKRALHLSTEAVLLDGKPLRNANETMPYPAHPAGGYSMTKAAAEKVALAHNANGLDVIVLRPRFIWGRDDTTALPQLIEAAKSGKLAWIDGGHYLTSTTHVANVVHGLMLALEKGRGGACYFISDGEPVEFRQFITRLLATQNVAAPTRTVPRWLVAFIARAGDFVAKWTNNAITGPMSWQEYATLGVEVTLNISKARTELGYRPIMTIDDGMRELSASSKEVSA